MNSRAPACSDDSAAIDVIGRARALAPMIAGAAAAIEAGRELTPEVPRATGFGARSRTRAPRARRDR